MQNFKHAHGRNVNSELKAPEGSSDFGKNIFTPVEFEHPVKKANLTAFVVSSHPLHSFFNSNKLAWNTACGALCSKPAELVRKVGTCSARQKVVRSRITVRRRMLSAEVLHKNQRRIEAVTLSAVFRGVGSNRLRAGRGRFVRKKYSQCGSKCKHSKTNVRRFWLLFRPSSEQYRFRVLRETRRLRLVEKF